MKAPYLLSLAILFTIASCRKDHPTPPGNPPAPVKVRLKDMTEKNLPSPSYHFEYNDSGDIIHASIYSGLLVYNVRYADKKISRMEEAMANRDTLQYLYTNGNLTVILVKNVSQVVTRRCFITYNASNQLQEVEWQLREGDVGYIIERTQQFSYYPDGNLKQLIHHFRAVGPQQDATFISNYEDYDDKPNADGFSLLHPIQLTHLILLPEFRLQANNPRKEIATGDGDNYEVTYKYTYDAAGRPTVKTGDLLWTSGPKKGTHFETLSTFSWYD